MGHYDVDCNKCGQTCFDASSGLWRECSCTRQTKVSRKDTEKLPEHVARSIDLHIKTMKSYKKHLKELKKLLEEMNE